jgi:Hint domain
MATLDTSIDITDSENLSGTIQPGPDGGLFELTAGTLAVGGTDDTLVLAPPVDPDNPGFVLLDDGTDSVLTGVDSNAALINNWTLVGDGTIGAGLLAITNEALILGAGSTPLLLNPTTLVNQGLIQAGDGTLDLAANVANTGGTIDAGGGVGVFQGILVGNAPFFVVSEDPGETILDGITVTGGTLTTDVGGTITAQGSTTLDGSADPVVLAGAQLSIADGATLAVIGSLAGSGTLTFAGSGVLEIGDSAAFAPTIAAISASDTIVVQDTSVASDNFDPSTQTLTLADASDATVGVIQFGSNVTGADLSIQLTEALCFAAGTRIAGERGEIAVEALVAGERVQTLHGTQPVIWIGVRRVDCLRHPDPQKVWPVWIGADAFGPGRPCRDLWLSPDHAVHVIDVLIPVKQLVNGISIAQVPVDTVTYYHVELSQHDVLLADGLPVESYLDTGNRRNFANSGGPVMLHPDFSSHHWEAGGCAPLVVSGPLLAAARAWVNSLARRDARRAAG